MRRIAMWALAVGLAAVPAMASGGTDKTTDSAKPGATTSTTGTTAPGTSATNPNQPGTTTQPASSTKADDTKKTNVEVEVDELRALIRAQSEQLEEQHRELEAMKARMATEPASTTAPADTNAPAAAPTAAASPNGAVAATATMETPKPQDKSDDGPSSIKFKGVTLTPGGFFAAESVWRSHALSADVNTPFNTVPYGGSSQNSISEFNASARQSRISMLVEGKVKNTTLRGYYETDFLSAGVTSNANQSNSYTLRQRQFWGQAAWDSGLSITGGQMWSLVTETKSGVTNRTEAAPMTIDAQYTVGFSWARQYGIRIAKGWNNKVWFAVSAEQGQNTFAAHGMNNNFLLGSAGAGGGLFNSTTNYTFNKTPDVVVKLAFEPGWGHYEVYGVYSTFRDRVYPNALATPASADGAFNDTRSGGGVGANARFPIVKGKAELGLHAMWGDGTGRYSTVGLPDTTVRPDGTLAPLHAGSGLGTLELHPTKKLDIYLNGGIEYVERADYLKTPTSADGYGSLLFNNAGCATEVLPATDFSQSAGTCTGDTKSVFEGTVGFWYRFYKGTAGTIQYGMQYSYVWRSGWAGGTSTTPAIAPGANENMIFTSLRYYIP